MLFVEWGLRLARRCNLLVFKYIITASHYWVYIHLKQLLVESNHVLKRSSAARHTTNAGTNFRPLLDISSVLSVDKIAYLFAIHPFCQYEIAVGI